jgi:hypothetical protein
MKVVSSILRLIHGDKALESRLEAIDGKCDRIIKLLQKKKRKGKRLKQGRRFKGSNKIVPIFRVEDEDTFLLENSESD